MNYEEHIKAGDKALGDASGQLRVVGQGLEGISAVKRDSMMANVQALAAVAQAHYAAANVRLMLSPSGAFELRPGVPCTIPGVQGIWEIRGMSTIALGERDPVEFTLYRIS